MAARRILDANAIVVVGRRDEVIELTIRAAELNGGLDGVVASAVEGKLVALERLAGFCGDVHDAGRVEAKLRRQTAGNQRGGVDQSSIELLSKAVQRLRKQNAVHSIGKVGVFAANVLLSEGIGYDPRHAEQHLLEGGVLA